MQGVNVLGVSNPMQFPDDMNKDDIREFLRKRFTKQAVEGTQPVELGDRPQLMQAYEPTLQEKTATAIGEGLYDSGIISDRFGAQNIGKNVSNIAAFSPAGAAFGGDEFGTAVKKSDKLGMALGALEGVGIGGDIAKLAIFGGVLAKSADLGALTKAKKLETGGANRDEIWKETGWANDNGDWKFEISDYLDFDNEKGADINPSSFQIIKDFGDTTQENFMGHPELYAAYPNLKDRPIRSVAGSGGQYNTGTDVVSIGDKLLSPTSGGELSNTQSVNLHELQHAIQQREKFAGGGSTATFDKKLESAKKLYPKYSQAAEIRGLLDEGVPIDDIPDIYKGMPEKDYVMSLLQDPNDLSMIKEYSLDELNSMSKSAKRDLDIKPHEAYERLAGEAEARNVQTRMDWTPEQRRETPPWASLDVPEDELIYRKSGGGKAMSVGDAAKKGAKKTGKWYHGTNADFLEFDNKFLGSANPATDSKFGFYFGKKADTADAYREVTTKLNPDKYKSTYGRTVEEGEKRLATAKSKFSDMFGMSHDEYGKLGFRERRAANESIANIEAGAKQINNAKKELSPLTYEDYPYSLGDWVDEEKAGRIIEAELPTENMKEVDFGGQSWDEAKQSREARQAIDEGFDGVIFKDMQDSGWFGGSGVDDIALVFDSKKIKQLNKPLKN